MEIIDPNDPLGLGQAPVAAPVAPTAQGIDPNDPLGLAQSPVLKSNTTAPALPSIESLQAGIQPPPLLDRVGAWAHDAVEPFTPHGMLSQPFRALGVPEPRTDLGLGFMEQDNRPVPTTYSAPDGTVRPMPKIAQAGIGVQRGIKNALVGLTTPDTLLTLPALAESKLAQLGRMVLGLSVSKGAAEGLAETPHQVGEALRSESPIGNLSKLAVDKTVEGTMPFLIGRSGKAPEKIGIDKVELDTPKMSEAGKDMDTWQGIAPVERQIVQGGAPERGTPPVNDLTAQGEGVGKHYHPEQMPPRIAGLLPAPRVPEPPKVGSANVPGEGLNKFYQGDKPANRGFLLPQGEAPERGTPVVNDLNQQGLGMQVFNNPQVMPPRIMGLLNERTILEPPKVNDLNVPSMEGKEVRPLPEKMPTPIAGLLEAPKPVFEAGPTTLKQTLGNVEQQLKGENVKLPTQKVDPMDPLGLGTPKVAKLKSVYETENARTKVSSKGLISNFEVAKDKRQQGEGSRLLTQVIADADKANTPLSLEVHLDNTPAIALYKKHGFEFIGKPDEAGYQQMRRETPVENRGSSGGNLSSLGALDPANLQKFKDREKELRGGGVYALSTPRMLMTQKESGFKPDAMVDVEQLINRTKNKLVGEGQMLDEMGVWDRVREVAKGGKITAEEAARVVQENGPRVEVRKFGNSVPTPEINKEIAQIEHKLDTLAARNAPMSPNWADWSADEVKKYSEASSEIASLVNRYREIKDKAQKLDNAHWSSIAPKPESEMPGYVEIAVVKPLKKVGEGSSYEEWAARQKAQGNDSSRRFYDEVYPGGALIEQPQHPSTHSFPPNTIGFARGYMETDKLTPNKPAEFISGDDVAMVVKDHEGSWAVHQFNKEDGELKPSARDDFKTWQEAVDSLQGWEHKKEKTFHVVEVQSDWAQSRRTYEDSVKKRIAEINVVDSGLSERNPERRYRAQWNSGSAIISDYGPTPEAAKAKVVARVSKETQISPKNDVLLKHYERLALKAAIDHAKQEGATRIAVQDAESAMLMEGHDRAANNQFTIPATPHNKQLARRVAAGNSGELYYNLKNWANSRTEEPFTENTTYFDSGFADKGFEGYKEERVMPQEKGMKLHYDLTLPKILKELTGQEGERVEFGEHKMAFDGDPNQRLFRVTDMDGNDRGTFTTMQAAENQLRRLQRQSSGRRDYTIQEPTQPRKDLIFRNPDGSPKTFITARAFPLSPEVKTPFSLLEKDKPGSRPTYVYGGIPFLDPEFWKRPENKKLYETVKHLFTEKPLSPSELPEFVLNTKTPPSQPACSVG